MSYKVFLWVGYRLLAVWMMRQSSDLQIQRGARDYFIRTRCDIRVCVLLCVYMCVEMGKLENIGLNAEWNYCTHATLHIHTELLLNGRADW